MRVCYKRKHRVLCLLSLVKQRVKGDVIAVCENNRGSSSREGKGPFKLKDNTVTRSTGCKLPVNKFRLEMRSLGRSGPGTAIQQEQQAKREWLLRWDVICS